VASDQLNAVKFLRLQLNRVLAGEPLQKIAAPSSVIANTSAGRRPHPQEQWKFQPQAHDHVLREEERKRGAFAGVCFYILANPVRAKPVAQETEWPFSGTVVSGYPNLHPLQEDYWELFWKLYHQQREPTPTQPLPGP
jgi:hypothetical protein